MAIWPFSECWRQVVHFKYPINCQHKIFFYIGFQKFSKKICPLFALFWNCWWPDLALFIFLGLATLKRVFFWAKVDETFICYIDFYVFQVDVWEGQTEEERIQVWEQWFLTFWVLWTPNIQNGFHGPINRPSWPLVDPKTLKKEVIYVLILHCFFFMELQDPLHGPLVKNLCFRARRCSQSSFVPLQLSLNFYLTHSVYWHIRFFLDGVTMSKTTSD